MSFLFGIFEKCLMTCRVDAAAARWVAFLEIELARFKGRWVISGQRINTTDDHYSVIGLIQRKDGKKGSLWRRQSCPFARRRGDAAHSCFNRRSS